MRKLTPFDRVEEIFMEADAEAFAQLEERIATIKRLRKLDRKPRKPKPAARPDSLEEQRLFAERMNGGDR